MLTLTGALAGGLAFTGATTASNSETIVTVFVHPSGRGADVSAAARANNGQVIYDYDNFDFIAVRLPEQARAGLANDSRVAFVEDDGIAYAHHHRPGHGRGRDDDDHDDGDDDDDHDDGDHDDDDHDDGDDEDSGSGPGNGNGNGNGNGRNRDDDDDDDDDDEPTLPSVETLEPTNVETDGVTLNGELTDLGSEDTTDVWFESRRVGDDQFVVFGEQTLDTPDMFSGDVGASPSREYEYRAVAESNAGKATGDIVTFSTPDPEQPDQEASWGHNRAFGNSESAKDETYAVSTGDGVNIGILDTGIQHDHPDLEANVAGGVNYSSGSNWSDDDSGHGTHVAGIAASADNGIGTIGVAPDANIWSVKVLYDEEGTWSDIIAGIDWCVSNDIEIISMSLGGGSEVSSMSAAIETAHAEGHLVITSAGNNGNNEDGGCSEDTLSYPAWHEDTVAVAAMDPDDTIAAYSSVGPDIDVLAPGSSINAPVPGSDYAEKNGTSMAAPNVSGVAALAWSVLGAAGPGAEARDTVEAAIGDEAETVLDTCEEGDGLVRADRVVRLLAD